MKRMALKPITLQFHRSFRNMSGSTATGEHGSSEPEWEHFRNSRLPFSRNAPFAKRKSRKPQRVDCSSTEDDASRRHTGRHAIQVRIVELPEAGVVDASARLPPACRPAEDGDPTRPVSGFRRSAAGGNGKEKVTLGRFLSRRCARLPERGLCPSSDRVGRTSLQPELPGRRSVRRLRSMPP